MGVLEKKHDIKWCAVKEAVLPFDRFAGVDPILGPEMKSTGEVMGIDATFEMAYWKSQIAAGQVLPTEGLVFLSAKDADKEWMTEMGEVLAGMDFKIIATEGTAAALSEKGVKNEIVKKLQDEESPNVLDYMSEGTICLIINTPSGPIARVDEVKIRSEAILRGIPIVTTESGARATVAAIKHTRTNDWDVKALQDYYT
jgi:carbamoyl-phosphate synthase large subunit